VNLILLTVLLTGVSGQPCSGASGENAHLHWSEPADVVSPDRSLRVEVRPTDDSDDHGTAVALHFCGRPNSRLLFTLRRDADLYWSADSQRLLIIDRPFSETGQLLLFSVHDAAEGTEALDHATNTVDAAVRKVLVKHLGPGNKVEFFQPSYRSWNGNTLLLAVGGATSTRNIGPMKGYCYGVMVNSDTRRVEQVISAQDLKRRTGNGCS
jgi:hypothetical protein